MRYEDQPTTTQAFLAGRFDVIPDIVYHWRIRDDGSSITQQRSSMQDLTDRLTTKLMALDSVIAYDDPATSRVFLDRVLAGDLHRYFAEIPGCTDDWWALLREGIGEIWGEHSLVNSGLPPVHRLTGWLVEQDRRADAATLITYAAGLPGPFPQVPGGGPAPPRPHRGRPAHRRPPRRRRPSRMRDHELVERRPGESRLAGRRTTATRRCAAGDLAPGDV